MREERKKLNILVTGVGGDIGQGIIKCLGEIGYHDILVGCDIDKYAAGKKLVDIFYKAPRASQAKEFLEFIEKVLEDHKIDYIIPSTEYEIKVFSEHRDRFDEKGVGLLINNEFIVSTFLDKYKTANFFEQNQLSFPKTYLISEFEDQLSFPIVLKLKESAGSKGVFIVYDREELNYFKNKYNDSIIQEYIGDIENEYTIGVFSNGEDVYHIAFRRYLGLGSLSKYVELTDDLQIKELAENVSRLTNLKGSINIQVRKVGEKYIVFEINPRVSSTVYFRHYFGFQDIKWWLDTMEGRKIKYIPKYTKGIGVRTLGEVFFDLE